MDYVFQKLISIWDYLIIKGGLIFSTILTVFLSAIGYPKAAISFIIILMVADIATRWFAEVVKAYGYFGIRNFFIAWRDKVLNSKKLKSGLYMKVFFYVIFLFIAHQTSIVPELAFGDIISNFLYSVLIVLDCISICENFIESGFDKAQFLLNYFNKKKNDLLDIEEQQVSDKK